MTKSTLQMNKSAQQMDKLALKVIKETTLKTVKIVKKASRWNNRLPEMMKDKVMRQSIRMMEIPRMKISRIIQELVMKMKATLQDSKALPILNKALQMANKALSMTRKPLKMVKKALPTINRVLTTANQTLMIVKKPLTTINKALRKVKKALRMANKAQKMVNKAPQMIRVAIVVRKLLIKVMIITKHKSVTEETRIMETRRAIPHRRRNRKTQETAVSPLLRMMGTLSCEWRSEQ